MHFRPLFLAICVALILCCQFCALPLVRAQQFETTKTGEQSRSTIREFILDPTTRQVIDQMKIAVSSQQEAEIAENFIMIASKLREIYDTIPQNRFEEERVIKLREDLLALIQFFTRKSDRPGVDMMKYSLIQSATQRYLNETQQPNQRKKNLADSEWITAALNIANTAMNIANDIGTYHQKISKVGDFISNQVSKTLDKVGLKTASGWAKNLGNGITKFSNEKIAPIENKVAQKIAPVVKSAPFQAVRRTLNVVTGVMSLKSGLNMLGMAKNVKLPKTFSALKSSIKTTTKAAKAVFKNKEARNRFARVAKLTGKRAYRTFKNADLKTKYKTAKTLYGGYDSIKSGLTFKRNPKTKQSQNRRNNQNRSRQYNRNGRNRSYGRQRNNRSRSNNRNGTRNSSRRSYGGQRRSNGSRGYNNRSRNNRSRSNSNRNGRRSFNSSRRSYGGRSNGQRRSNSSRRSYGGQRRSNGSRGYGNRSRNTRSNSNRRSSNTSRRSYGGRSRQSTGGRQRGYSRGRSYSRPSSGNRSRSYSSPRRSSGNSSRGYSRGRSYSGGSRSRSYGGGRSSGRSYGGGRSSGGRGRR